MMVSKSPASHLTLRETLSSLTFICLKTGKNLPAAIHIDWLFGMTTAVRRIQKSILSKAKYHLLIIEINQWNLKVLQKIKMIQKIMPTYLFLLRPLVPNIGLK